MSLKDDFTDGDHSFKKFMQIMWKNFYVQLFLIFLVLSIIMEVKRTLMNYPDIGWYFVTGLCHLGVFVMLFAMIVMWTDLKNGKSR